ncbi:DNA-binding response regulator [Arsenicibacter rosenii]|uniref:DNA-binding response regulator n=2 Tax=Arsenicibacter rosenii TaxID=1750698 RepID=A0A1S2VH03_9BACT|nr:DNA-binding response regulator [Arsenicibacter rosenii]
MKLLLIEDEDKLSIAVRKGLMQLGYRVDTAYDGQSGLSMALEYDYDVVILDINLPLLSGFQVCQLLRTDKPQIPVLMLTALESLAHKKDGYATGASDYLTKPFLIDELHTRILSLYTRFKEVSTNQTLRIADLELNGHTRQVTRSGQTIDLTAREYAMLEYLLLNKNRIISRVNMYERILKLNVGSSINMIDVYINYLRRKIDKHFSPKLIYTIIGIGYMLKDPTLP